MTQAKQKTETEPIDPDELESKEKISNLVDEDDEGDLVLVEEAFQNFSGQEMAELIRAYYDDIDILQERLDSALSERDDLQQQLLRKAAELENYRKRTEREKEEIRKHGIDSFAEELLPAMDSLEKALEHIESDESEQKDQDLLDGVQMVFKQLKSALNKKGIEPFESEGKQFDPQYHEAIQQIETPDHETGTVLEEFQTGYTIHDRLLRPALVAVARKVEETEQQGDGE